MFPKIEADLQKLDAILAGQEETKPIGKASYFDYQEGQHWLVDGKDVKCGNVETVVQWIEKVLRTERGKYPIYTEDEDEDFGISVYQYIGEKIAHPGFIASELKREITEQLLKHRHISGVEDFRAGREGRTLWVQFTAVLTTGDRIEKKVAYHGF